MFNDHENSMTNINTNYNTRANWCCRCLCCKWLQINWISVTNRQTIRSDIITFPKSRSRCSLTFSVKVTCKLCFDWFSRRNIIPCKNTVEQTVKCTCYFICVFFNANQMMNLDSIVSMCRWPGKLIAIHIERH